MLIEDLQAGSPERNAVDFFIFPDDAPADFYEYAYTTVDGKDETDMPGVLRATFATAVRAARSTSPDAVGEFPGFEPYPLIRLDDRISGRIVEAVVHWDGPDGRVGSACDGDGRWDRSHRLPARRSARARQLLRSARRSHRRSQLDTGRNRSRPPPGPRLPVIH